MTSPRVLWFGDLSASGFGTVTMDLGRALLDLGMDVRFISQNELGSLPEPFASRTIDARSLRVAAMNVGTGGHIDEGAIEVADVVPKLLAGEASDYFTASGVAWGDWRPDVAVVLADFVGARLFIQPHLKEFAKVPTFHYCPVEGIDLPPAWGALWRTAHPVACSRFGAEQIGNVTGVLPPMVHHGIDTDVFRPATPAHPIVVTDEKGVTHTITSKAKAKHFFGASPDRKWILRTDRHMPRKNYNEMLRALAPVVMERPDVDLVLHCRAWDQGGNIPDTMSKFAKEYQDRVYLTGLGAVPRDVLAIMYNAADVLCTSGAEGFGLTIAEAIACGTPAVGLDFSSVPEVIGPAGMVVPIDTLTDNEYDHLWARPNEQKLGESVAWLLDHPKRAREIGSMGPKHVRDSFQWPEAARQFSDLLRTATGSTEGLDESA